MSKLWNNVYFQRFRSGLVYVFLNTLVNHFPCWTVRKFFYRICGIRIGKGARIGLFTVIDHPKGIVIGDRTIINENCYLDGRGGCIIGNDTSISIYSKIVTASHRLSSSSFEYYRSPVVIGNNVWTGIGAIVLDGSNISDRAVIGAGTIIKGFVRENCVIIGNHVREERERNLTQDYELFYKPFFR